MRSYDVAITSLAIDAPQKWTDNLLSHHGISTVISAKRGVSRRITPPALILLALTRQLHTELGIGVGDALSIATALLTSENNSVLEKGHLRLSFDRAALERTLATRLGEALEFAPTRRRGRPPQPVRARLEA